ncbi:unnamed protein product [Allacma fusca]|uniref:Uncharacterized protein n=1 Tax=Allacma fusca TaxID=39272 RepID=A0A8J2NSV3_9HEXA|nr:unnamed protein product [Allacma fusca]
MKVDQLSQRRKVNAFADAKTTSKFSYYESVKTITAFEDLKSRVANDPDLNAEPEMIKGCTIIKASPTRVLNQSTKSRN